MEKSLEVFKVLNSKYPMPTDATDKVISGVVVGKGGSFGKDTLVELGSSFSLSEVPTDPLTDNEYAYSVLGNGIYQLGLALESQDNLASNILFDESYAASADILTTHIVGNYNDTMLKFSTGGVDYIMALPTLISSDSGYKDIALAISNKKISLNGTNQLPYTYNTSSVFPNRADFSGQEYVAVNTGAVIVFSGSFEDLEVNDNNEQIEILVNLKEAYSLTPSVENNEAIKEITELDIDITGTGTDNENYIGSSILAISFPDMGVEVIGNPENIDNTFIEEGEGEVLPEILSACEIDLGDAGAIVLNNAFSRNNTKSEWCALTYLDTPSGILTSVPSEIGNLVNLMQLSLYINDLTSLPSEIGNLVNLESLDLDGNSGLGSLSNYFDNNSESFTEGNITIVGNGATIDITID